MKKIWIPLLWIVSICLLAACGIQTSSKSNSSPMSGVKSADSLQFAPVKATVSKEDLASYSPEMKKIFDRGKLRAAMISEDREPFFYVNADGKLTGSDVDMATDIAAKFGVEIEFLRTAHSFDEVVNQIVSGEADIAVSKLSATLSRAKKVLFSQPYVTLRQGLLLNRLKIAQLGGSNKNLLNLIQGSTVKIGVISGTSYVGFAKELFPKADILQYETSQKSMNAALQGEIDAIFYDELQLKRFVEINPKNSIELQLILIKDQADPITIAVPPNNMQMLAWINLYLETNHLKIDGLLNKYDIVKGK